MLKQNSQEHELSLKDFQNLSDFQDEEPQSRDSVNSQDPDSKVREQFLNQNLFEQNSEGQQSFNPTQSDHGLQNQIRKLPMQSYPVYRSPFEKLSDKQPNGFQTHQDLVKDTQVSMDSWPNMPLEQKKYEYKQDKHYGDIRQKFALKQQQISKESVRTSSPTFDQLEQMIVDCKNKVLTDQSQKNKINGSTQKKLLQPEYSRTLQFNKKEVLSKKEYIEYLQFRTQIFNKRMYELQQNKDEFGVTLIEYHEKISAQTNLLIERARKFTSEIYQNEVKQIKNYIDQLQNVIAEVKSSQQQQYPHLEPVVQNPNECFDGIKQSLEKVIERIQNWTYQTDSQTKNKIDSIFTNRSPHRLSFNFDLKSNPTPTPPRHINGESGISYIEKRDEPDLDRILKKLHEKQKQNFVEEKLLIHETMQEFSSSKQLKASGVERLLELQQKHFNVQPILAGLDRSPKPNGSQQRQNILSGKKLFEYTNSFAYEDFNRSKQNHRQESASKLKVQDHQGRMFQSQFNLTIPQSRGRSRDLIINQIRNGSQINRQQQNIRQTQTINQGVQNALQQQSMLFFNLKIQRGR